MQRKFGFCNREKFRQMVSDLYQRLLTIHEYRRSLKMVIRRVCALTWNMQSAENAHYFMALSCADRRGFFV